MRQTRAPVTTRDVARAASVSRVTVSRVLNNHASVTPRVRQRVLQAATDLGYFGQHARPWTFPAGGRSRGPLLVLPSVGFFFTSVYPEEPAAGNPFWSHVLHGVERDASAAGISLMYRFSRKRAAGGLLRSISRQQAWEVVRAAADRANVRVLALRVSRYGQAGEPAPIHPHLLRHARVRQIVRTTKSLAIAQKQAGWSRLQMAYLSVSDEEVRQAMRDVDD